MVTEARSRSPVLAAHAGVLFLAACVWMSALDSTCRAQTPTVVSVAVTGAWVDTGVNVNSGDRLVIKILAASATIRPQIFSKSVSLAPVIGRIGKVPFEVGRGYEGNAPNSGELFLRINARTENTAGVSAIIYHTSQTLSMPDLVGRSEAYARASLGAAPQLSPQFIYNFSKAPAGQVYNQDPVAGADLSGVRSVEIYVSRGPISPKLSSAPVPSPSPTRAAPQPSQTTSSSPTNASPTESPAPAKTTTPPVPMPAPRTTTALPDITVPLVIGQNAANAIAAISNSGLRPAYRGEELNPRARGQVTRTEPVAGSAVARGSLVGYWTADGTNAVPNVTGLSSGQAAAALRDGGFVLGEIVRASSADLVTGQNPGAGSLALVGSVVAITVGKRSPAVVIVPVSAGLLAVLSGVFLLQRVRLANITRALLAIHPSVDVNGPVTFTKSIRISGPTVRLRASLELGEVAGDIDIPIVRREVIDG